MYSFLLESRILPEEKYEFFTYKSNKPVSVNFRGKDIAVTKGTRFGVRKSTSGKHIRLIFPNDPNRVITIDPATADALAKGVK